MKLGAGIDPVAGGGGRVSSEDMSQLEKSAAKVAGDRCKGCASNVMKCLLLAKAVQRIICGSSDAMITESESG